MLGCGRAPPGWPDHPLLLPSVIAVGKILCPQGTSCARSLGVGAVSQSGCESSWHFCGPQFGRGGSRRRRRVGRRDRGTLAQGSRGEFGWKELTLTVGVAAVMALVLFVVIPLGVAKYFEDYLQNALLFNLAEGMVRIIIFILYVVGISLLPDLRRVFEYHGAEHKVIHAYEAGEELDPNTVNRFSPLHPRCGTAFLLVV